MARSPIKPTRMVYLLPLSQHLYLPEGASLSPFSAILYYPNQRPWSAQTIACIPLQYTQHRVFIFFIINAPLIFDAQQLLARAPMLTSAYE